MHRWPLDGHALDWIWTDFYSIFRFVEAFKLRIDFLFIFFKFSNEDRYVDVFNGQETYPGLYWNEIKRAINGIYCYCLLLTQMSGSGHFDDECLLTWLNWWPCSMCGEEIGISGGKKQEWSNKINIQLSVNCSDNVQCAHSRVQVLRSFSCEVEIVDWNSQFSWPMLKQLIES